MPKLAIFIGLTIACILFVSLTMIVYFIKKKVYSIENQIYSIVIVTTLIGLIFELFSHIGVQYYQVTNNLFQDYLFMIVVKIFIVYVIAWTLIFNVYVFTVTTKIKEKELIQKKYSKMLIGSLICIGILGIIVFSLPLNVFFDGSSAYTYGYAVDYLLMPLVTIIGSIWFVKVIINRKEIKGDKRYIPIILCMVLLTMAATLQLIDQSILLVTTVHTLVSVLMFHTIENPDMKMVEQLNLALEQVGVDVKSQEEWLKQMRHETNTPAGQVKFFNSEIKDWANKNNNTEIIEWSNYVDVGIDDLTAVVQNSIEIAHLENKKFELAPNLYKTEDLFYRINQIVKYNYSKDKEHIKFIVKTNKNFPKYLFGDFDNVLRIFLIYLSNSFKNTEKGKIELNVKSEIVNNKCILTILVKDTGFGIEKDNMPKLFKKFQRFDFQHTQGNKRGIGIGLSIAKHLTELMNGNVNAESIYGKGSTFTAIIEQGIPKGEK